MTINNDLLQPLSNNKRRETRSCDPNQLSFATAQSKTTTYQKVIPQPNEEIMERTTKEFDKQ